MLKFKVPKQQDLDLDQLIFDRITFGNTQPSPKDDRDYIAQAKDWSKIKFPKEYRAPKTEVLNQENYGSCVAHSCATALAQGEQLISNTHNNYSRGYIYGNRKSTDLQTEGMIVRQALKQLHNCGDVLYDDFPYNKTYPMVKALIDIDREYLANKAKQYTIFDFYRCCDENQLKDAIISSGAVIIVVPVYSDFARDLHKTQSWELRGYHAMALVGWTADKWIVQNSWGLEWGYDGCLLMDMDYPIIESWGITVNKELKKSLWYRIKTIFKQFWNWIKYIWNKIFKK